MTRVPIEECPAVRPAIRGAGRASPAGTWRLASSRGLGRRAAAAVVAVASLAAVALGAPLGRLRDPLTLVLVLPPLAVALEVFGWSHAAAAALRRLPGSTTRAIVAYCLWLVTSAFLTLDVAAVAAASVGVAVGGRRASERDVQLGSAILGSNGGSLLFPYSNLTNLIVLAGAGIGFGAYVRAALAPQLAAALALGLLLAWRGRRRLTEADDFVAETDQPRVAVAVRSPELGAHARLAGAAALAGAVIAVAAGCAGLDVAPVFAVTTALVCALAVGSGAATPRRLATSIPLSGVLVIVGAAAISGPMAAVAGQLAHHVQSGGGPLELVELAALGGVLAAVANNLPAAAFGAVLLSGAGPDAAVAYLIGTNIAALATTHGSLATILCRAVARRAGHDFDDRAYLRSAWRFAAAGSGAALIAAAIFR